MRSVTHVLVSPFPMQENEGVCKVPHGGSVSIVDVPGHERLRRKLDTYLKDSR